MAKTPSQNLLASFLEAVERRGDTLHNAAHTMGVKYVTIYFNVKPRKNRPNKGTPKFSYDFGRKLEDYIKDK